MQISLFPSELARGACKTSLCQIGQEQRRHDFCIRLQQDHVDRLGSHADRLRSRQPGHSKYIDSQLKIQ